VLTMRSMSLVRVASKNVATASSVCVSAMQPT
jgi:hypothetical protein